MSMWVGLGGWFSGSLSQDGFNVVPKASKYPAWWEVLPRKEIFIKGFYATLGQLFIAETTYQAREKRHFYMYNYATGKAKSFSVSGISENDRSTADNITAERLTVCRDALIRGRGVGSVYAYSCCCFYRVV